MSLANHSLLAGGLWQTLADWGVTDAVVTVGNQGMGFNDSMTLTVPRSLDDSYLFAVFDKVVLFSPAGNRVFQGWLLDPPLDAEASSETHTYVFSGPWHFLEGIVYRQNIVVALDPANSGSTLTTDFSAKVILNRNHIDSEDLSLRGQLADVLEYAITQGAPIEYDLGDAATLIPPRDEQKDLFCSDVVDGQIRWTPALVARWEYSGVFPKLVFANPGGDRDVALTALLKFQPRARYDLLVKTFRINYLGKGTALSVTGNSLWLTTPKDVSTVANGSFRVLEITIELTGDDTAPEGLAAALHAPFMDLIYDLNCEFLGTDPDWNYQVGERWSITGTASRYASANSLVQTIARDIGAGSTSVTTGAPNHLGLGDLLALVRKSRQLGTPGGDNTFEDGEAEGANQITGQFFELKVPDPEVGEIVVIYSTVGGVAPDDFGPGITFTLSVSGDGVVFVKVVISATTGAITARTVEYAATLPPNTATDFYEELGNFATDGGNLTAVNGRFGPVGVTVCRDWFGTGFSLNFS